MKIRIFTIFLTKLANHTLTDSDTSLSRQAFIVSTIQFFLTITEISLFLDGSKAS